MSSFRNLHRGRVVRKLWAIPASVENKGDSQNWQNAGTLSDFRGKLSLLGESHQFVIQRGIAAVIQEKHPQAILRDKRIMSQDA